jgi:magnesium chelatase subunit D
MGNHEKPTLPFSAIVGQDRLKLGLILNVINPRIGGLLIQGPKGTGKSTAAHALSRLLPDRMENAACPYRCIPDEPETLCDDCRSAVEAGGSLPLSSGRMRVIPMPLSISEDRLVGAIDMEKMLSHGEKAFQPGLLALANHNVLYVDEINLLPDHVADDILDAAALGWSTIEREGFSITHPSSFVLVGTMNPEEGSLRPQLLDRLPLSVTLTTIRDVEQRVEIIRRNLDAEKHLADLRRRFEAEESRLESTIADARARLPRITLMDHDLQVVARLCVDLRVDGHRPEIVITRTATALAAYRGRSALREEDLREAAFLALGHRTRDGGFDAPATEDEIGGAFDKIVRGTKKRPETMKMPAGRTVGDIGREHPDGGGGKKR